MKRMIQNTALSCASIIFCLLFFELTVRFFIGPSPDCYGILFNKIKLPPYKPASNKRSLHYGDKPYRHLIIKGKKITNGDMMGIMDDDPLLGYVPRENAVSKNGWWRTNNLGARSPADVDKDIPFGKQRFIIFGESFTNCSGVPGEESWPYYLNNENKNVEFINFGAGGYSMGQCLLRYEDERDKIDYDVAMLVFVTPPDLWRDINMLRQLIGWQNVTLLPRFMVQDGHLVLVGSPYRTYRDFQRENNNRISPRLKKELQAYDRLYFSSVYESPPFWGNFILYKLLAKLVFFHQRESILKKTMEPGSEAMTITLKIFEKMDEEVKQDGKKFVLVILPLKKDIARYGEDPEFRKNYDGIISAMNKEGILCIDLMKNLSLMPPEEFDTAYDGTHMGSHSNKIISEILWHRLKDLHLIDSPS